MPSVHLRPSSSSSSSTSWATRLGCHWSGFVGAARRGSRANAFSQVTPGEARSSLEPVRWQHLSPHSILLSNVVLNATAVFLRKPNWQQNLKGGVSSFPCYSLESFSWMFSGTGFWNHPVSFLEIMSLFPHRQLLSKLSVAQKGNEEVISSPGNTVVYLDFILYSCLYVFLEQSMNSFEHPRY